MNNPRITMLEYGWLTGQRPRSHGKNARLHEHGQTVRTPFLRITTEDGFSGFGRCHTTIQQAAPLLDMRLDQLFSLQQGTRELWQSFDYPLWDLAGQRAKLPVYKLLAGDTHEPLRVACYDTSLYIDDLHLVSHTEAAAYIATEARAGYAQGHRAFKLKVGRGARHMELEAGIQRDIAIIRGVREAVGPQARLMIDANNGYNLNIARRVLHETADCAIYWLEEAFHEDGELYQDLHAWLQEQHLAVLIADGEGNADPQLLDWAHQGWINLIQYDIFSHGFTRWLSTGRLLADWGVRAAPHHYGTGYGNYVAGHLAGALSNLEAVEWDEVTLPGLDASRYTLADGAVTLPDAPGFGLALDEAHFQRAIAETGFSLSR